MPAGLTTTGCGTLGPATTGSSPVPCWSAKVVEIAASVSRRLTSPASRCCILGVVVGVARTTAAAGARHTEVGRDCSGIGGDDQAARRGCGAKASAFDCILAVEAGAETKRSSVVLGDRYD